MVKNPFANIPTIQPQADQAEPAPAGFVEESKATTKGVAPKNILGGFQKVAVPLMAIGVLVWLVVPGQQPGSRRVAEEPQTVVDRTVQTSNTSALLDSLKDDANKAPTPAPVSQPKVGADSALGAQAPLPGGAPTPMAPQAGYPFASGRATSPENDAAATAAQSKIKREEEIRASSLESPGTFVLVGEGGNGQPKSSVNQLEDELARLNTQRNNAGGSVTSDTANTLAALTKGQPPQQSRNANQEFLSSQATAGSGVRLLEVQPPAAAYMVQEGTAVRTVLLNEVSSDMPGKITARVTSDVYDSVHQRYVMIPKGSKLIGVYNNEVVVGQERTLIAMTRLILPDGSSVALGGASASDLMGKSGLKAEVNNHFWKMFSSSFVIGASSLLLGDKKSSVATNSTAAGSVTTGSVAGLALNDVLQTIMNRNKNIQPTLTNAYGQEFMFMVMQDMSMPPYRR